MSGINLYFGKGNLGGDPEIRTSDKGTKVCEFSMATNQYYKDYCGKHQQSTTWVKVVAWGRLAEVCSEYLHKGDQVFVEGSIRNHKWLDKSGQLRTRTTVDAKSIDFLKLKKSKKDEQEAGNG